MATIQHFLKFAEIPIEKCFSNTSRRNFNYNTLNERVESFLMDNIEFIKKFEDDYYSDRTVAEISEKIGRPKEDVLEFIKKQYPGYYENRSSASHWQLGHRYISSFAIDKGLGGDYSHLSLSRENEDSKEDLPQSQVGGNSWAIGYEDIMMTIEEQIDPILNPSEAMEWGLQNPGGIILFGPPGCGKTFWAQWISRYLDYELEEVPRSIFGSIYVDGAMKALKEKLEEVKKKPKTLLFFDEFDSIAQSRQSGSGNSSQENSKVVNTLLQEIPKLAKQNILVVAATNFLDKLDPAVIRPGRFDLKIPVFPPTPDERIKLLNHYIKSGATENSLLHKVLKNNQATNNEFWDSYKEKLDLFTTSMIIDLSMTLKKKLKSVYKESGSLDIELSNKMIVEAIEIVSAKQTRQDLEGFAQLYNEVSFLSHNRYQMRSTQLKTELAKKYEGEDEPPRPIGFRQPDID